MDAAWKTTLWRQFGAAIDMLENAIDACPSALWGDTSRQPQPDTDDAFAFWYVTYHTLFWLDFHLSGSREDFAPPAPFTLSEFDPSGMLPDRVYSKGELLTYIRYCRDKCRTTIEGLTDAAAERRCTFPWGELPFGELLLYDMRHVQHHTGQLNLLLRQSGTVPPRWVMMAGVKREPA